MAFLWHRLRCRVRPRATEPSALPVSTKIIHNIKRNTPRSDTPDETRQTTLSVVRNDREHAGILPQQPVLRTDTADGLEPGRPCDC